MFDWVPKELYTLIYYYLLFAIVLVVLFESLRSRIPSGDRFQFFGSFLLFFSALYMGFRPISGFYFGDTSTYAQYFDYYTSGGAVTINKDLLFHSFMKWSSNIMTVHYFFVLCAFFYLYPLYLVCKKWFKELWFFGFLFLITAFSFWSYGTNGIRNGIAGSLFLLGLSRDKRVFQILWIVLAIGFHKTMLLPTAGFILANVYNQPKKLIMFWVLCIPLSLLGGGLFESFFGSLGFDERLSYLTDGNINDDDFSSTGFRWDFVMYSATAIYAGWYYIIKKGYQDKVYYWLFNTYIFANAFWILVIRANFSNRFAYLSWFMIGLVIVYPLLRDTLFVRQYKKIGVILFLQFLFTFIMNVIL
ncbi:EpsG family protein [Mesoflavibacter zeaxanthinifaciens]|uniref:EpsG family protein n=1 Tax=Mesoflavibacter zeaxanthinifaciens TaxID=393060 RepID=UPI003A948B7F